MFKFLLEGSLGDILAPVTGTNNQLFLAIQHSRNEEMNSIIIRDNPDLSKTGDSGYAAIHVASRYNNRYALETCLGRGVPVNLADSNGNTPLHYGAKYGQIDICRALVEKGASTTSRNAQGQTPYDIAENHVIRQYLLPLQLQSERQTAQETYSFAPSIHAPTYALAPAPSVNQATSSGPPTPTTAPPPPPTTVAADGQYSVTATSAPGYSVPPPSYPPAASAGFAPPTIFTSAPLNLGRSGSDAAPPTMGPPVTLALNPVPPPLASVGPPTTELQTSPPAPSTPVTPQTWTAPKTALGRQTSGGGRIIQPDGFHSSASDPNLQAKYGHIKEVINIAPPPTGAMGSTTQAAGAGGPPQYSMFAGAAPPTYNRYVAYDPNSGPAAPAPPQQHSMGFGMPSFSTNASLPMYGAASPGPPPAVAAPPRVYPPSQTGYGQPPGPYGAPQGVAPTTPPTSYVPPAPTSGKPAGSAPLVNINVFNPATDCDIVTADASSKAIL